jgi:sialidase-1
MNWKELIMVVLMSSVALLSVSRAEEPLRLAHDVQERCLGILRAGMKSDEFWPAMHAAEALTLAGHADEVVAALRDRLPAERNDQRRCGLARELIRAGERGPLTVLLDILSNPESTGRVYAAESLFKLGEASDKKQLRAAFAQAEHPQLRLCTAAALARIGETDALQVLRKELQSTDRPTRITVTFALSYVGGSQDIEPLLKALDGETDSVARAFLVNALAKLGHGRGRQELVLNLKSTDAIVRTISAEFAGHVRCVDCQARLIRLLDNSTLDNRVRAAQALIVLSLPAKKR